MKLHHERLMTPWIDTKLQLFKGDLEKQIQRNTYSDPWASVDRQSFGSTIWKIHKFTALHWPDEEYGNLYTEDVYLILSVRGSEDVQSSVIRFRYDIHVWSGLHSSKDDYHTALYKMTELDERFNNLAVLHREVEGMESGLFKSYFNPVVTLDGGSAENFKSTLLSRKPYSARLLKFYKPDPYLNNIRVKQVQANVSTLDNMFVYILDVGHTVFQYNGSLCKQEDAVKAMRFIQTQKANRGGTTRVEMLNEMDDEDNPKMKSFFTYMSRGSYQPRAGDSGHLAASAFPSVARGPSHSKHTLIKVSSKKGKQNFQKVKEGPVKIQELEKMGVALYDTGSACFVWIGRKTKNIDRYQALEFIHEYLRSTNHPTAAVTVLREGQTSPAFHQALTGGH